MIDSMEEKPETSLRDLLSVVFRRKGVFFAVFLAALGLAVGLWSLSPLEFESNAQLLVSRGQPESAFNNRVRNMVPWEEELASELETITSSHVVGMAQKLIDDNGVKDSNGRPIKINPRQLIANTPGKSSVIYLRSHMADPLAAKESARAIVQAYTNFRVNVRSVPELETYFREEIDAVREQLEDWEQRRADFMSEESVSRLPEERSSLIQIRQTSENDLNSVRSDLAAEQAKFEVMQSELGQASRGGPEDSSSVYAFSETSNNDDQVIFQMRRELVTRRSELMKAQAEFQDQHPSVITLKEQVTQLEELLSKEIGHYQNHLRAKVEVLRAREDALLSALAYIDAEIAAFPSKEARLASFDRMIQALQTDYQALLDKQIQARMERIGSSDWNVVVLQPASEPIALRTRDTVRLALIPIIGLIVALAAAFLVDGLDHTVKDAGEAEEHFGLPVLGSVGRLR
jgi:polysaccharide biosynthesis transport protein